MSKQVTNDILMTHVVDEVPSGTMDGANLTFTILNNPAGGTVQLYLNGTRLVQDTAYTVSGKIITFVDGYQPIGVDSLLASYIF